jgi:hydroxymethylpyrimidine/phosphomethylpyrimidine kinase
MKTYKRVLTIAGSDSGGGAGIQADIKAISAIGCYSTSAITAITAQNTLGVTDIHPIPVSTLKAQIYAVLEDIGTDSVKIGMLHNSETIRCVFDALQNFNITNIVLDPVMVATSGNKLLKDEAIQTLMDILIPSARVITPNIPEAEILLEKKIEHQRSLPDLARELSNRYNNVSVLLKAGHLEDEKLIDVFYNSETDTLEELSSKRVFSKNTHGTGCSLSSAFASFLALGFNLSEAAIKAKNYINNAIIEGADYKLGKGHGPVKHFFNSWKQ